VSPTAGDQPARPIAIVGSTSPVGKQLREILDQDGDRWRLTMLDTDGYAGLLQEFGGEIEIVQVISPDRLEQVDCAVFACDPSFLDQYLAGKAYLPPVVLDLTGGERVGPAYVSGVSTTTRWPVGVPVVAPRAATVVLTRILTCLEREAGVEATEVTILEPASESGKDALDRLQEETVEILNFQAAEDATGRHAFNLIGPDQASGSRADRIARQVGSLTPERCPAPGVQIAQAPVFDGLSLSIHVQLRQEPDLDELIAMLVAGAGLEPPGTATGSLDALGSERILLVRAAEGAEAGAYWLWITTDNLRLAADNAARMIRSSLGTA